MKTNRPVVEAHAKEIIEGLLSGTQTGRGVCEQYHVDWDTYTAVIYPKLSDQELLRVKRLGRSRAWSRAARQKGATTQKSGAPKPPPPRKPDLEPALEPPWWMCSGCGDNVQAVLPGRCPKCGTTGWERIRSQ